MYYARSSNFSDLCHLALRGYLKSSKRNSYPHPILRRNEQPVTCGHQRPNTSTTYSSIVRRKGWLSQLSVIGQMLSKEP